MYIEYKSDAYIHLLIYRRIYVFVLWSIVYDIYNTMRLYTIYTIYTVYTTRTLLTMTSYTNTDNLRTRVTGSILGDGLHEHSEPGGHSIRAVRVRLYGDLGVHLQR